METLCIIVRKDSDGKLTFGDHDIYPASVADARAAAYKVLYPTLTYGVLAIDDSAIVWNEPQVVSP